MYFDERRAASKKEEKNTHNRERVNPVIQQRNQSSDRLTHTSHLLSNNGPSPAADPQAINTLDRTNNKLQELMQLLYLLSRDPGVPNDARYHVTVAQGEIALLAHVLRNTPPSVPNETAASPSGPGCCPVHP
jgi:hypothetical protein